MNLSLLVLASLARERWLGAGRSSGASRPSHPLLEIKGNSFSRGTEAVCLLYVPRPLYKCPKSTPQSHKHRPRRPPQTRTAATAPTQETGTTASQHVPCTF